jgi:hypothetical protein
VKVIDVRPAAKGRISPCQYLARELQGTASSEQNVLRTKGPSALMDYHFKPPSKTCATTGKPLSPGTVCHSVLIEKNGVMTRFDYSDEAWQGPPEGHLGYWKTVVPAGNDPREQRLDPDTAFRYFEQLSEEMNPEYERRRYVLALLLLQHRKLRLDGSRPDDCGGVLELSGVRGEGTYEVQDLQLPETVTRQIQAELKVHLATEWN